MKDWILLVAIIAVLGIATFAMQDEALADNEIEETFIDEEYVQICEEVGEEYHISPELLEAIIETESAGEQYADNGNCKGLCQIYYSIHINRMHKLGLKDIYDPRTNITLAADILSECREKYGDDLMLTLMAYNGTAHAIEKANAGYFSDYAEKVSNRAADLEKLHGKHNYSGFETDVQKLEWRANDD